MRKGKPTIFFASSSEAEQILDELSIQVVKGATGEWAFIQNWYVDTFEPGTSYLDSLKKNTELVDFAVLLYTPEDTGTSRGETFSTPRDNIIFELGFFLAKLKKEHVLIVRPKDADLKIPSDYSGHEIIEYNTSEGQPAQYLGVPAAQIKHHFQKIWQKKLEEEAEITREEIRDPTPTPTKEPKTNVVYKMLDKLVPIYRDLETSLNWFSEFENSINQAIPFLNTSMLYFGPGLAKNWIHINKHKDTAFEELYKAFVNNCIDMVEKYAEGDINLIDLGVGDFEKGRRILERLLKQFPEDRTIRYFPLDISFDMIDSVLNTSDNAPNDVIITLNRLLKRGEMGGNIIAINARFSELFRYNHLFSTSCRNIFLLLGNTLGNERRETITLANISKVMKEDDILITELQLAEEEPYKDKELTKNIQAQKNFYAGPFLALGCDPDDIELFVRQDDTEVREGENTIVYKTFCKIKNKLDFRIKHVAFQSGEVMLPDSEICTAIIRKYDENAVEKIFNRAKFKVLENKISKTIHPKDRKFCYIAAKKINE